MMHYLPEIDCDLPSLDLLSLVFDSPYPWAHGDTVVYADAGNPDNSLTRAQLATIVKRLAYSLRHELSVGASGPEKDVVTCFTSNHLLLPAIFYSVIGAGGIYSAASVALTVPELARQIQGSNSTLIIASEDVAEKALEAAKLCKISPDRILILRSMGHNQALTPSIDSSRDYFAQTMELPWEKITDTQTLETRVVALLFSSGTTGVPKGVCLSHKNFVAEAIITQAAIGTYLDRAGRRIHADFEYRALAHLPAAHISGLQGYFINGIMAGGTVFWMAKFVFEDLVRAAKVHRPTFISTVPSVFLRIAKDNAVTNEFDSLEHAQSGAAPMGPELQRLAESKLRCKISQAWGMTETTGAATWLPWDRVDNTGSISQLLPNMRLKIVDDEGNVVPDGHQGEILIRGPNITQGYWNNPSATAEAITADGWLRTGDIGLHRDGKFYIVDRKKELIKYKGLQISPAELEAVLVAHERIHDAAVVGVPDPKIPGNELPKAFVVPGPGRGGITADEVRDHVQKHLASHKQLRGGVEFIELIPRNPSGKILRRMLSKKAPPQRLERL